MLAVSTLFLTLLVQRPAGGWTRCRCCGPSGWWSWSTGWRQGWRPGPASGPSRAMTWRCTGIWAHGSCRAGRTGWVCGNRDRAGRWVLGCSPGAGTWHMLPDLGFRGAMRLSVLGRAVLPGGLVRGLCHRAGAGAGRPGPGLGGASSGRLVLCAAVTVVRPAPWMPNLITQGRLLGLAAVDCLRRDSRFGC